MEKKRIQELLNQRALPPLLERSMMLQLLLEEEYGVLPPKPTSVTYHVTKDMLPNRRCKEFCAGYATAYRVIAALNLDRGTFSFPFQMAVPKGKGPYPFIVSINFHDAVPDLWMPVEDIIENGYAVLSFCYQDIASDTYEFTEGLSAVLYENGQRGPHDAGKIAMWAWAAQRLLDYAETQKNLDMTRAAVCGHSRLGKTALLAAATDERFRFCYSNNSGSSGAALARGNTVETKEMICRNFPHWFCEAYNHASSDPHQLPFDQHYLLACIAPRYVLVGSAEEDEWADTDAEFLSAASASEAYEAMGVSGLVCEDEIPTHDAFMPEGHIGYHVRPGSHYFGRTDWNRLMQFINLHS